MVIAAGACTRESVEFETGGERGIEGEAVPQQSSCAHEQQLHATTGPLLL